MVLYKKKNNDLAPVDNALDRLAVAVCFQLSVCCLHRAGSRKRWRACPLALAAAESMHWQHSAGGNDCVGNCWLGRQIQRAISGEPLNVPKYLLLAAAIPMHWIVLLTPMPHKPIAIVAILTIYHNLQYHRLIWFHNQKYRQPQHRDQSRQKFGTAALISRRLLFYIAFGILFGLIYQGPRQLLGYASLQNESNGGRYFVADAVGSFLSVGLRVYSLLPRLEDLARATRRGGGQGAEAGSVNQFQVSGVKFARWSSCSPKSVTQDQPHQLGSPVPLQNLIASSRFSNKSQHRFCKRLRIFLLRMMSTSFENYQSRVGHPSL